MRLSSIPHISSVLANVTCLPRRLRQPLRLADVAWAPEARDRIIKLANGYPYFLQLFASETWEQLGDAHVNTLAQVHAAEPHAARRLDTGIYATRYERVPPTERQYLVAMAMLISEGERVRSGAIAAALGKALTDITPVRDRLIRKGAIHASESGVLEFSVPEFPRVRPTTEPRRHVGRRLHRS